MCAIKKKKNWLLSKLFAYALQTGPQTRISTSPQEDTSESQICTAEYPYYIPNSKNQGYIAQDSYFEILTKQNRGLMLFVWE